MNANFARTNSTALAEAQAGFPPEEWQTSRPTQRVAAIRQRLLQNERQVDLERARITTRSYQRSEGLPMIVRRAQMLLDNARQMSIAIYPGELIVGNRSRLPRMGVIAPEGAVNWVDQELEFLPTRPQDRFNIRPEQIEELRREIFPYWRGQTLEDAVARSLPPEVRAAVQGKVFSLNQTDHAQGHILPDVEGWLRLGIGGIGHKLERAAARRAGAEGSPYDQASRIALQAAQELIQRYARLAQEMAAAEPDRQRQAELRQIAENCAWIAENPPHTFWQALQAVWFLFVLLQVESNASSFSPGRLDQYLLPYLQADLAQGRLTLDQAQELLELLFLKFNEIVLLRSSSSARYFAGFPIGFNLMLGGQRPDGSDATNLLSFLCLRAQADLGLTQPNLSIRIHRGSPAEFLRTAAFVISKGSGMPQVFNDEVIIPGQLRRGITLEDALNYAAVGCVELTTPGKALGWSDSAMFNLTRVLELTLFGGRDPLSGEQIGLPTPPLGMLGSFAELEEAFDRQLGYFIERMVEGCNIVDRIHAEILPSPFLSLHIHDCIERGVDVTAGGAHYNFSGPQGVQVANVADSLAAVRQAVFEEGWLSREELLDVLKNNFAGQEALRQRLIQRVPKFGNDDDRVDQLAAKWANRYCELVAQYPTVRNQPGEPGGFQAGFYTVSAHLPMGANVGATPDGRKRGEPLADGGLSPMAGRDRNGPTAVLRSLSKLDLKLASNGTLLNMKVLPLFFNSPTALDKFVQLLRAFSELKIPHIQFNVVSSQTLRQAQSRPEEYRHLVVRVAGYSAYFVELDRQLQDEIIRRTEFSTVDA